MNKKYKEKLHPLTIRLPQTVWDFVKDVSHNRKKSVNHIVIELINKYKKKCDDILTNNDTMVS